MGYGTQKRIENVILQENEMAKAKKKKAEKKEAGEQLQLIDVGPKNLKEILASVKIYMNHQKTRLSALKDEIAEKHHVLELVKAANLKPLADGVIRFECGGEIITIEPRDEVIRIKKVKKVEVKTDKS